MAKSLSVVEINSLLSILTDTKKKREQEEREVEIVLLHDFLSKARMRKQEVRSVAGWPSTALDFSRHNVSLFTSAGVREALKRNRGVG